MSELNIDALRKAELRSEPFDYTIVPGFISEQTLAQVISTYPDIMKGGSFPLESIEVPDPLQRLVNSLDGPEFEQAVENKFSVRLNGQPKMYSLRGYCRRTDGKIHTDSKDKIITALLYLNRDWREEGGKLRMLRGGMDLDDYAEEVPPDNGTLLIFKRSENSWHGHGPFEGERRSIQMNWMVSTNRRAFHELRHSLSAKVKKFRSAG